MRNFQHSEAEITLEFWDPPETLDWEPEESGSGEARRAQAACGRARERSAPGSPDTIRETPGQNRSEAVYCDRHSDMSTDVETEASYREIHALSNTIEQLRATLRSVEGYRDDSLRRLRSEGYSAIWLANAAGVNRARIYVILSDADDAPDDVQIELYERIENAWQSAIADWENSDQSGSPEDFFPVEQLLVR
jgi:hypothetical protein